jgi:O-antigen biosynthesis protein
MSLTAKPLEKGWYKCVVHTSPSEGAASRITLRCGDLVFHLPATANGRAHRIIRITASGVLQPVERETDCVTVHRIELNRLSPLDAILRLVRDVRGRSSIASTLQALCIARKKEALWSAYDAKRTVAAGQVSYREWIDYVESRSIASREEQLLAQGRWKRKPVFSLVLPINRHNEVESRASVNSVIAQTYGLWELLLAQEDTEECAAALAEGGIGREQRVRLVLAVGGTGRFAAINGALAHCRGDHVVLLDERDVLPPHALHYIASAMQRNIDVQLLYTDEDEIDEKGERSNHQFKPDWSPDFLHSRDYLSRLSAIDRSLLESIGGARAGYEGSEDYDIVLRACARIRSDKQIVHVPRILCHRRKGHRSERADASALRALQDSAGVPAELLAPGLYRLRRRLPSPAPLVSLIIPTRDGLELLSSCIESILQKTSYRPYEIIVVDNQSTDPATLAYLDALPGRSIEGVTLRVLRYDAPFNYSAINNHAVSLAKGTVIGLINNDIEVINGDWLDEMACEAVRPDVGCVGAKLHYPDGTIQHGGVILGVGGVGSHAHRFLPADCPGYMQRLVVTHNLSAVTAAALLVRKDVFERLGGLDEHSLRVGYNDVDFCLKARAMGLLIVFTPFARLVHHESKTRGSDKAGAKRQRLAGEAQVMKRRWKHKLRLDPYYNPNLSLHSTGFELALDGSTICDSDDQ